MNTQLEYGESLHTNSHMILCHKLIKELSKYAADNMTQLSLKVGMKHWKGKGQQEAKYEKNQMHFRDIFITNHYKELTEEQNKIVLSITCLPRKREAS